MLEFGVYYPSSSGNSKRQIDDQDCNVKHVHHKHKRATEVVQVTQTVFVDGNGNTVTSQALQTSTVESSPVVSSAAAANDNADSGSSSSAGSGSGSGYGSVSALTVKVKLTDPISQLNLLQLVLLLNHLHQKPPLLMVLGPETVIIPQDPPITVCS